MSQPGWYPDPSGTERQFRYWDGTNWSASTSTRPSDGPPTTANRPRQQQPPPAAGYRPTGAGAGPRNTAKSSSNRSVLVWALVGVLAVALVSTGIWALFFRDSDPAADPLPPPSTVTPWDEVTTPTPTPTPTPTKQSTAPVRARLCPYTELSVNTAPPDGREHGGGISFATPAAPDWNHPVEQMVPWISDTGGVGKSITYDWFSMILVGQLNTAEFGKDPRHAAHQVMSCTASSGMYRSFTGRTDTRVEPMQVAGRNGFRMESDITVNDRGPAIPGDRVVVITLDTGDPQQLAVFMASATLGDQRTNDEVDAAIATLDID